MIGAFLILIAISINAYLIKKDERQKMAKVREAKKAKKQQKVEILEDEENDNSTIEQKHRNKSEETTD
mgnify:CR=1 FL=1